jgi:hypothetical protein
MKVGAFLVSAGRSAVGAILRLSGWAQIAQSIIRAHAVDVIEARPDAVNVQKRKASR